MSPRLPADLDDPLANLLADDRPKPLFAFDRHRWVGAFTVKCDLRSAMRARERLGGAVEHAFAVLLADGTEVLTRWKPLLPHENGPHATRQPIETGQQADPPHEAPTREHEHG